MKRTLVGGGEREYGTVMGRAQHQDVVVDRASAVAQGVNYLNVLSEAISVSLQLDFGVTGAEQIEVSDGGIKNDLIASRVQTKSRSLCGVAGATHLSGT